MNNYYQASDLSFWSGRGDSLPNERFFQIVKLIDLSNNNKNLEIAKNQKAFALIGFASDAGIIRNLGRPGAHLGPLEFRKHFANLALSEASFLFYDLGNIICPDNNVEAAQTALAHAIEWALNHNLFPLVIGGGHELSFGAFQGTSDALKEDIGIINFDAHFDLRDRGHQGANSGTSFSQIALYCKHHKYSFNYLVLGIQPASNTKQLFKKAQELEVTYLSAQILAQESDKAKRIVENFLNKQKYIYLSLCLDVFSHSIAPGVSAPQSLGLLPEHVLPLIKQIAQSQKVLCVDLAEYSPPLDCNDQTAKLSAMLIYEIISYLTTN